MITASPDTGHDVVKAEPPKVAKRSTRLSLYIELLLLDAMVIGGAFFATGKFRGTTWLSPEGINVAFPTMALYLLLAFNGNAYSLEALASRAESVRRALRAMLLTALTIVLIGFYVGVTDEVSRISFAVGYVLAAVAVIAGRWFFHGYARRRVGGLLTDELLIVDGSDMPHGMCRHVIDARAEGLIPDLQNPAMLQRLAVAMRNYDRIVVAAAPERQFAWSLLLKGADVSGEIVIMQGNALGMIGFNNFAGHHTAQVARGSLNFANRAKKRALDLVVAVPALVFLSPLLIVVAIAIKLDSPGPVFFRQPRMGRGNHLFEMLKFRSMRTESSDVAGAMSTARDDDRITRVGRLIRRTSIDELPQLINVLRSDMSLVGPRPHALGSLAGEKLFWEVTERYWLRHALKPGITGLAQVRGYRGATHEQLDLERRLQADLEYISGWQLWRDVVILFRTLGVLWHKNAY